MCVWQEFKRINIRTAAWWDGIAERDLTACADQLAGVFTLGMGKTVLLRESVLSVPVAVTNRSFDWFSPDGLLRHLARSLVTRWQRDRCLLSHWLKR